jgi:ferric-dicitrate binding protein FerR (iron transport regulator)
MTEGDEMTTCEHRDGSLGKWLTEEERLAFEAHLANCPDCRQFLQEQRRLDELLSGANAARVPVPARLIDQIEERLRRARRRRVAAWAAGLAAASISVCFLAAWLLSPPAPEVEPVQSPVVMLPHQQTQMTLDPRSLVEVKFQPSSDVIAVPQKTGNPSVTIIWVYPTIKTVHESTSVPTDSFQPFERNGI